MSPFRGYFPFFSSKSQKIAKSICMMAAGDTIFGSRGLAYCCCLRAGYPPHILLIPCITVKHGDSNFQYNTCYTVVVWSWSYQWPSLLDRTPTWDTYAALAVVTQDRVRRTRGRGMDLGYPLYRVPAATKTPALRPAPSTRPLSRTILLEVSTPHVWQLAVAGSGVYTVCLPSTNTFFDVLVCSSN